MFALYDDERQMLLRFGLLLATGAAAVLPFTLSPTSLIARADAAPSTPPETMPAMPSRIQFPEIGVSRDPFVPSQVLTAGKGEVSTTNSSAPLIRAVITGDHPRALVEVSGVVQVLAIGDKIGTDTIAEIDAGGVMLSNGTRLVIAPR